MESENNPVSIIETFTKEVRDGIFSLLTTLTTSPEQFEERYAKSKEEVKAFWQGLVLDPDGNERTDEEIKSFFEQYLARQAMGAVNNVDDWIKKIKETLTTQE